MLRFPNPGSTLHNFIEVYKAAFEQFHENIINLDDLVKVTVQANLATSSGYMGSEAISRSTRKDRSRDPLYNQLKMYAELFRTLGWLHPTEQRSLSYTFTLLGEQVVAARRHYKLLLGETALGIAYPSHILKVSGSHDIRPIAFILRTMLACGGALSRDEMIVGPLNANSDRSNDAVRSMADSVKELRESPKIIAKAMEQVAKNRGLQTNTLKNYTRWPLAIMRDLGWTQKVRLRFQKKGRSFEAHCLTDEGKNIAERVVLSEDIRVDQVDRLPSDEKAAISIYSHYEMLGRAGFDISSVDQELKLQKPTLDRALDRLGIKQNHLLLFSPFQTLKISDIQQIFPTSKKIKTAHGYEVSSTDTSVGRGSREHLFVASTFIPIAKKYHSADTQLIKELQNLRHKHTSANQAASTLAKLHASDTKEQFYPFICQLFHLLHIKCEISRAGVNYQRWDACIWLDKVAIPIEIKSPTEEEFLSTKAIRQALENKIVFLARAGLQKTTRDTTSLVIGNQIPNERGDMSSLIDDIYSAFRIKIGVIDIRTLVLLAIYSVTENRRIHPGKLRLLKGFLRA